MSNAMMGVDQSKCADLQEFLLGVLFACPVRRFLTTSPLAQGFQHKLLPAAWQISQSLSFASTKEQPIRASSAYLLSAASIICCVAMLPLPTLCASGKCCYPEADTYTCIKYLLHHKTVGWPSLHGLAPASVAHRWSSEKSRLALACLNIPVTSWKASKMPSYHGYSPHL